MELTTADVKQVFTLIKQRDVTRAEIIMAGIKREVAVAAIRNLSENNIIFKYTHADGAKFTTKRPIQSRARPPKAKHVIQIAECYQHLPLGFRMGYTNIIPARGRIIIGEAGGV